ncbi:MAG: hypothetical protein SPL30_00700 [Succinivibrio sp.]|nr:hypothetical protein [Succinivibrio sp.]
MKKIRISDCYEIQSGAVLSRFIQKGGGDSAPFKYRQLTMAAVDAAGFVDERKNEDCSAMTRIGEQCFTKKGDIVMKASLPCSPFRIDRHELEGLLLSSNFFVLRPKSAEAEQILDPLYLVWVLREYANLAIGAGSNGLIKRLRARELGDTEVILPDLKKQQLVGRLYDLRRREIAVRKREAALLEEFYLADLRDMDAIAKDGGAL